MESRDLQIFFLFSQKAYLLQKVRKSQASVPLIWAIHCRCLWRSCWLGRCPPSTPPPFRTRRAPTSSRSRRSRPPDPSPSPTHPAYPGIGCLDIRQCQWRNRTHYKQAKLSQVRCKNLEISSAHTKRADFNWVFKRYPYLDTIFLKEGFTWEDLKRQCHDTGGKFCHRCRWCWWYRWQMCHQCQRHRRQICRRCQQ